MPEIPYSECPDARRVYDYFSDRKSQNDVRCTDAGDVRLRRILGSIENKSGVSSWVYCDAVLLRDRGAVLALYIAEIPRSRFATALAAETEDMAMLQLLVSLGFTVDPYALVYAVQRRNARIARYVVDNMAPMKDLEVFEQYDIPSEFKPIVDRALGSEGPVPDTPIR